jgi:hypothetical protein
MRSPVSAPDGLGDERLGCVLLNIAQAAAPSTAFGGPPPPLRGGGAYLIYPFNILATSITPRERAVSSGVWLKSSMASRPALDLIPYFRNR